MKREFEKWNTKKIVLDSARGKALFHEREIWWCTLGVNLGFEQDGNSELFTRPVVIIKKFNLDSCLVIPLTTKLKKGKYYFSLGEIAGKPATAVLSQIRYVDRKRLALKMTTIEKDLFNSLLRTFIAVCIPNPDP